MNRRAPLVASVCLCASFVGVQARVSSQVSTEPSQIRVVWSTDPAHRATVSWSTGGEGVEHLVHYDVQPRAGVLADYSFSSGVVQTGEYESGGPYFHHGTVTDLPADSDVYFVVESDGEVLGRELHFHTAPDDDSTVKFLYGGDSRTGRRDRQSMNRLIARLHDEDPDILALVHGGDYIAYANNWDQWNAWLDDQELTIGADGRVLPIVPAKGNHEGRGLVYNEVFGEPSGDPEKNWFYTRFGSIALVNLDTEASLAGEQRDWLRDRLTEGRDARWLLVNYHRPAYPAAKSPSGAREHWVPLFEEFDVDLVCESDGHTLKRTAPIRNEKVDFTGVTYVGEGGLGVPRRTPKARLWYLRAPGMAAKAHHVQKIELTPDLLRYQALLMDGTVADEVTILPREERLAQHITATMAAASSPAHIEVSLSRPFDPVTAVEGEWEIDPPLPVHRVEPGPQVASVLALANSADVEELDDAVGLDARAARNIIKFRAGADGDPGTSDDEEFLTWAELDAVSYVGKSALNKLTAYALAQTTNERNIITLSVDALEPGQTYRIHVPEVADRDGTEVEPGTTVSFVYTPVDDRADAIAGAGATEDDVDPDGGCSTSGAAGGNGWLFALVGALIARRRSGSL